MSSTVTIASQVAVFPLISVTVSVTVFGPIFAQVKSVWLALKLAIPQVSVEPPSKSTPAILAFPETSN